MKTMTRRCGDHFHAALFDDHGDVVLMSTGSSIEDALRELDVLVLGEIILMMGESLGLPLPTSVPLPSEPVASTAN